MLKCLQQLFLQNILHPGDRKSPSPWRQKKEVIKMAICLNVLDMDLWKGTGKGKQNINTAQKEIDVAEWSYNEL